MTPGCDSREDNNLSSDAEVPTLPAKTLPLSRSRSLKRDIVGTYPMFVFYSLVDVRDGFARDCPHRHPVAAVLALRDRSRVAPDFLVEFRRFQRSRARRRGGESRRGRGGGRGPRDRLASQVRWSGVLREPWTTDPCQSSGPRRVGFRDGARQVPEYAASRTSRGAAAEPTAQKLTMTRGALDLHRQVQRGVPALDSASVVAPTERRLPGWSLATAHKLVRVIHAGLHDRPYTDPGIDDERLVVERNAPRWIRSSASARRTRGRRIATFRPPSTT